MHLGSDPLFAGKMSRKRAPEPCRKWSLWWGDSFYFEVTPPGNDAPWGSELFDTREEALAYAVAAIEQTRDMASEKLRRARAMLLREQRKRQDSPD